MCVYRHSKPINFENLPLEVQQMLRVLVADMENRSLGYAVEIAEMINLVLDPRFKTCCPTTCVNGAGGLQVDVRSSVMRELKRFMGSTTPFVAGRIKRGAGTGASASAAGAPSDGRGGGGSGAGADYGGKLAQVGGVESR